MSSSAKTSKLLGRTDIIKLCLQPESYISSYGGNNTEDSSLLLFDILQQMWLDDVNVDIKLLLLTFIEEQCHLLLTTEDSVEQTVGSLNQLYASLTSSSPGKSIPLRSQLIITITSILIQKDVIDTHVELFCSFMKTLLRIISNLNTPISNPVRATACACLEEVEQCYPGLLHCKLEHFFQMCHFEHTACYQYYATLFATTLHHAVKDAAQRLVGRNDEKPVKENYFTQLLVQRTESLVPLRIDTNVSDINAEKLVLFSPTRCEDSSKSDEIAIIETVNVGDLKTAVSFLINNSHAFSSVAMSKLLYTLTDIVHVCPDLPAAIFKSSLIRYLPTSDVALFHNVLDMVTKLRAMGPHSLLADSDIENIRDRVMLLSCHPSFTAAQRLIYITWLADLLVSRGSDLTRLYPRVFDGVDTQLAKISLLVRHHADTNVFTRPHNLLQTFYKPVMVHGIPGRVATALYRALFIIYRNIGGSDVAVREMVVTLITTHATLADHTIGFLDNVMKLEDNANRRRIDQDSAADFVHAILVKIVQFVRELPNGELLSYMDIMCRAAVDASIRPIHFLQYLTRVFQHVHESGSVVKHESESIVKHDDLWSIGNQILTLCRQLMLHHDVNDVFTEFADFLFKMMSQWHESGASQGSHMSVSVRDHAKFYYCLLMHVSADKIKSILSHSTDFAAYSSAASNNRLATFVTGNTTFASAQRITVLDVNIVKLVPVDTPASQKFEHIFNTRGTKDTSLQGENIADSDLVALYWESLTGSNLPSNNTVTKQFEVSLIAPDENLPPPLTEPIEHVFALDLEFHSPPVYSPVGTISLASCKVGKPQIISVEIDPVLPVPANLSVNATFTASVPTAGSMYTCQLADIQVTLEDLFLPIPLPPGTHCRSTLANVLWKQIEKITKAASAEAGKANGNAGTCSKKAKFVQSICCLPIPWDNFKTLSERLSPFMLPESNDIGNEKTGQRYAIFLPPYYHFFMDAKSSVSGGETIVVLYVDSINLLPFVNDYLHKFIDVLVP